MRDSFRQSSRFWRDPLCVLFLSLPCAFCQAVGSPLDRIVAVVNNDVILESELIKHLESVREQLRRRGAEAPPGSLLSKQVLDRLVQDRLQMQIAEAAGIRIDEATLRVAAVDVARRNGANPSEFRAMLKKDGYSYGEFLRDLRQRLTIQRLHQRVLRSRIVVNDREIDDFLGNQELQTNDEAEVRISHILLSWPAGASEDELRRLKEQATATREELLAGADFAALARRVSHGRTAVQGGDLGWRKLSEIPSLFSTIVPTMREGEISEVIESPNGYHIIQLTQLGEEERIMVEQVNARHILVRPDELHDDEAIRKRLTSLRHRIVSGDDFATLAKAHSEDPLSAIKGGDLGWTDARAFTPRFEEVIEALEEGEISEPFASEFGWHIAQVLGRRTHDNTESMRRTAARTAIFDRKLAETQRKWLRDLRDEAYVEYRFDQ